MDLDRPEKVRGRVELLFEIKKEAWFSSKVEHRLVF